MDSELVVFFNPACSKSRGALEILDERNADYRVVEYLVAPPDRATLESLVDRLIDPVADLVRTDDAAFASLGADPEAFRTKEAVIELLLEHPELMQRPVVARGDRAVIARPPERLNDLV